MSVSMFENEFQRAVAGINAHDSPLAALDFNPAGTKLATASTTVSRTYLSLLTAAASQQGTVIRVFSIPKGDKLFEFRRGMKRYL